MELLGTNFLLCPLPPPSTLLSLLWVHQQLQWTVPSTVTPSHLEEGVTFCFSVRGFSLVQRSVLSLCSGPPGAQWPHGQPLLHEGKESVDKHSASPRGGAILRSFSVASQRVPRKAEPLRPLEKMAHLHTTVYWPFSVPLLYYFFTSAGSGLLNRGSSTIWLWYLSVSLDTRVILEFRRWKSYPDRFARACVDSAGSKSDKTTAGHPDIQS